MIGACGHRLSRRLSRRRIDRCRLPQPDGADCAIGAQQQGEVAGQAPCGLVFGVLLIRPVLLELHQQPLRCRIAQGRCHLSKC